MAVARNIRACAASTALCPAEPANRSSVSRCSPTVVSVLRISWAHWVAGDGVARRVGLTRARCDIRSSHLAAPLGARSAARYHHGKALPLQYRCALDCIDQGYREGRYGRRWFALAPAEGDQCVAFRPADCSHMNFIVLCYGGPCYSLPCGRRADTVPRSRGRREQLETTFRIFG